MLYSKPNLIKLAFKGVSLLLVTLFSFFIALCFVEVLYRYQAIDFYKNELKQLNPHLPVTSSANNVLVFGDSFTAANNSYVNTLRKQYPKNNFINSAISGIGAQEINCLAKGRIEQFNPSLVILQLYVGNDLLDIEKPISFSNISIIRNVFWLMANRFYGIRYFNYKLGQLKYMFGQSIDTNALKNNEPFDKDKISKRELLLIKADPFYYQKSISLDTTYFTRYHKMITALKATIAVCTERNVPVAILVVPASCQVSYYYQHNLELCGAKFNLNNSLNPHYPFVASLKKEVAAAKVQVLNPLHNFQNLDSNGTRLYYENDLHLNDLGNERLGNFLAQHIKVFLNKP